MNRDIIIWRKGKFQYKQVVTKLLEGVIVDAIGRAEDYIQRPDGLLLIMVNYKCILS